MRLGSWLLVLKRAHIECGTGNVEYRTIRQLPSRAHFLVCGMAESAEGEEERMFPGKCEKK